MSPRDISVEAVGGLRTVRLNRPDVLNALRRQTILELEEFLDGLAADETARAAIITGEGRAFCAGGDIKEMSGMGSGEAREFAELAHSVIAKIRNVGRPVIASVNGAALGAGFDLATSCDLVIASEGATFGSPTLRLGIITPFGGSRSLGKTLGPIRAKHLIFTGDSIDARAALGLGLVGSVVRQEDLAAETMKLAEKVMAMAPVALGYSKRLVNLSTYGDSARGDELEAELYAKCFETSDRAEGMRAFFEKRRPAFKGV